MDGARVSTRKFPAYTTATLKAIAKEIAERIAWNRPWEGDEVKLEEIKAEIASREAGKSVVLVVPQL